MGVCDAYLLLMTLHFDLGTHHFVVIKKILSNFFKC